MKFHSIANFFPMMETEEFDALVLDVKENGLLEPIWIYQNQILDGRNRFMACAAAGIEPKFREYIGDDPMSFAMSMNIERRHLTPSQRACLAVELLPFYEQAAKERQIRKPDDFVMEKIPQQNGAARVFAAEVTHVNPRYVSDAKMVKEESPSLFEEMKAGLIHMKEALSEVKKKKKQETRAALAKAGKDIPDDEFAIVTHGDFREVLAAMPDNSIDMIFTDPPYDEESIPLYSDLARLAAQKLKSGGSLITYAGHYAIGEIYNLMVQHLRYWWIIADKHNGNSARLIGKNIFVEWKPLLWFVKDRRANDEYVADLFQSSQPKKLEHDWQQDTSEAAYYIERLTNPGDLVVDPFAGSGTTLLAAKRLSRRSLGIEIDKENVQIAKHRLQTEG